ncbi:hypothetical protein V8F06_010719 [Rhypophila decipiens]
MKSFAAILSLVAAASAIDLYAFNNYNCGGTWGRCANINPNVCCVGSGFSVQALGIPIGWHITLHGRSGGGCNGGGASNTNQGQSHVCVNGGFYTGSFYTFNGKKRAAGSPESECQRPDVLGFADGTEYDLSSLTDDEIDALLPSAFNATSIADAPEELKLLQIK